MTDWKERQAFERGVLHGIALTMLSAGLSEMSIDERRHALWSYMQRMSIDRGEGGSAVYRLSPREPLDPPASGAAAGEKG